VRLTQTRSAPAVAVAGLECPGPSTCAFTPGRVHWYMVCWRLAEIIREPFDLVLRSESRNSKDVDPWIRGGKVEPDAGRIIRLSLEHARDHHGIALTTHNAERISRVLCPGPHVRPVRRLVDKE
jgi:hypothetical protein